MRRLPALLVLLAVLAAGVLIALRAGFFGPSGPTRPLAVSPQAAAGAEVKLSRLIAEGEEARLNEVELTSLFRYRPEVWNLGIVNEPEVRLQGDTVTMRGGLVVEQLSAPELDPFRAFIPDTTVVVVRGTIRVVAGQSILDIGSVELAGMPIPDRLYPEILNRLGRDPADGLPPASLPLPLPAGIGSVRVEKGELILTP